MRDRAELGAIFTDLCSKLAGDLARKGYAAKTIGIKLRFDDFRIATRALTLPAHTLDGREIRRAAGQCLKRVDLSRRLRLLGVRASALAKLSDLVAPHRRGRRRADAPPSRARADRRSQPAAVRRCIVAIGGTAAHRPRPWPSSPTSKTCACSPGASVPRMFYDYADSGSWTESTYRANESDFQKIKLRQRVAVNMDEPHAARRRWSASTWRCRWRSRRPGCTGMQHADGEILAARAAEKFGVPFTLSTMSICSIEDVAANTKAPFWFQLYVMRDRDFIERLIDRAKAANCSALVLTLDLQILGQRHKDIKNGLSAPPKPTLANILNLLTKPRWCLAMLGTKRRSFGNIVGHVKGVDDMASLVAWTAQQFDPTPELGRRRVDQEALGRQADPQGHPGRRGRAARRRRAAPTRSSSPTTAAASSTARRRRSRALPAIVDAVGSQIEVWMDGGIRSGQDVLKAWALGARGTLIGRAFLYGLGAMGEAGVTRAWRSSHNELDLTMAFCGHTDIRKVDRRDPAAGHLLRRRHGGARAMKLEQLHDLRLWHQRHVREQPLEKHVWDIVLTFWLAGWVGVPAAFLIHAGWAAGALRRAAVPARRLRRPAPPPAPERRAALRLDPRPALKRPRGLGRAHAVAAGVLGGVERRVGAAEQRFERVVEHRRRRRPADT